MNKRKCVVCLSVKGKRGCQIKENAFICPHCCAQIRNPDCQGCFYYSQAQQYAATKTHPSEAPHFAMRVDPDVEEAVDRALVMIEGGDRNAGELIVSDLVKKHPDLHVVQYAMGVVCAIKEQYVESIAHFDKAIAIFPYFVEAWFNKGVSHEKKLRIADATRAYRKVIELGDPADEFVQHANNFLNNIEEKLHQLNGITLDDYIKANDKFDEAFATMQQRNWQQAIYGFQAVIELNPGSPQSYGNAGICYAQLGRRKEALESLNKALELDPNYEPALLNREIVSSLKEGEKLTENQLSSVEYYKDYTLKNKSMIEQ